jgi:hypothetical protein
MGLQHLQHPFQISGVHPQSVGELDHVVDAAFSEPGFLKAGGNALKLVVLVPFEGDGPTVGCAPANAAL